MEFKTLVLLIVVVLFVAVMVIFPKARVLLKGFVNVFIEDRAKTPEGAKAVYQEAIDQAKDDYAKANNILQKLTGKLDTAKNDRKKIKSKIIEMENKCETFAKQGSWDQVQLYAEEKESLEAELAPLEETIKELEVNVEEAQQINSEKEKRLKVLQREKETVVAELIKNKQLKEIYDSMDELKANDTTSKLLQSVKEGAKDTREAAVGARAVHNNKTSTKIAKADAQAAKLQSNAYVEELKKKYGQK